MSKNDQELIYIYQTIADLLVNITSLADDFSELKRITRTKSGQPESNSLHSFSLALACIEIASLLNQRGITSLNVDKVCRLALVHDFAELATGDVPTFSISDEALAAKHHQEEAALPTLLESLGKLAPELAKSLKEYEDQDSQEAWFVRTVDKLIPAAVYVTGDGMETLRQSTDVKNIDQLKEAHDKLRDRLASRDFNKYPEIMMPAYKLIHERFEQIYQEKTNS